MLRCRRSLRGRMRAGSNLTARSYAVSDRVYREPAGCAEVRKVCDKGQLLPSLSASPRLAISALLIHDCPRFRGGGAGAADIPGVEGDIGNVADGVMDDADGRNIAHDPDVVELVAPE
jgi:hypothetical protein